MNNEIIQQLRAIFSENIYDLPREKVNLIVAKLESLGCPYYSDIAFALRTLFPVIKLHPWVFVLNYEELMYRFLLDSLHQVLHGLSLMDIVRSDIREIKDYTSVYRFRISKALIRKFRKYQVGIGSFPRPPRGWNIYQTRSNLW